MSRLIVITLGILTVLIVSGCTASQRTNPKYDKYFMGDTVLTGDILLDAVKYNDVSLCNLIPLPNVEEMTQETAWHTLYYVKCYTLIAAALKNFYICEQMIARSPELFDSTTENELEDCLNATITQGVNDAINYCLENKTGFYNLAYFGSGGWQKVINVNCTELNNMPIKPPMIQKKSMSLESSFGINFLKITNIKL